MSSIFLSHSSADRNVAVVIRDRLKSHGIGAWLDQAEIRPGDSLIEKIGSAIRECRYVAVLLSPASVASRWVQKELEIALAQEMKGTDVKVLPLLIATCSMPAFLEGKAYADFTVDFDLGFEQLLDAVRQDAHRHGYQQRRVFELLQQKWTDWNSFGQKSMFLLEQELLSAVLTHLSSVAPSPELLRFLLHSAARVGAQASPEVIKLLEWLAALPDTVVDDILRACLTHVDPEMRTGCLALLRQAPGSLGARVLWECLARSQDSRFQTRIIETLMATSVATVPEPLAINFTSRDVHWTLQAWAWHSLPPHRFCLLVGDGTDFAQQLESLLAATGLPVVAIAPSFRAVLTSAFEDRFVKMATLVVVIRGEYFVQGRQRFYDVLSDYVRGGGRVFATSWVAWETKDAASFYDCLPFSHVADSYHEDEDIECLPARTPVSKTLFPAPFRLRTSFELLAVRSGTVVLCATEGGTPILGFRAVGAGYVVYLNSCQHSCRGAMESPLVVTELRQALATLFAALWGDEPWQKQLGA